MKIFRDGGNKMTKRAYSLPSVTFYRDGQGRIRYEKKASYNILPKSDLVFVMYPSGNGMLGASPDLIKDSQTLHFPRLTDGSERGEREIRHVIDEQGREGHPLNRYVRLFNIPLMNSISTESFMKLVELIFLYAESNGDNLRRSSSVVFDFGNGFGVDKVEKLFKMGIGEFGSYGLDAMMSACAIRRYLSAEEIMKAAEIMNERGIGSFGDFTKMRNIFTSVGTEDAFVADLCRGNALTLRSEEEYEIFNKTVLSIHSLCDESTEALLVGKLCPEDGSGKRFFDLARRCNLHVDDDGRAFVNLVAIMDENDCREMKNLYPERCQRVLTLDFSNPLKALLTSAEARESEAILSFVQDKLSDDTGFFLNGWAQRPLVSFLAYLIILAKRNGTMEAVEDFVFEMESREPSSVVYNGDLRKAIVKYVQEPNGLSLMFHLDIEGVEWKPRTQGFGTTASAIGFML